MSGQHWNPSEYASNARFVSDLAQPAIELLDARAGERVLDLGCGDGALAEQLALLGVSVVGIDSSAEMVAAARARGLDARLMDATRLAFEGEFDAVFSNAVLHWVPDLGPVLAGVHRALKPGGRFAAECGGHGCVAAVCTALRAVSSRRGADLTLPWKFRGIEEVEVDLVRAGFQPLDVQLIPRPTPLPTGIAGWLRTFAAWAFDALPATEREAAFTETIELLRPTLCDHRGHWMADYVRLRFVARRRDVMRVSW